MNFPGICALHRTATVRPGSLTHSYLDLLQVWPSQPQGLPLPTCAERPRSSSSTSSIGGFPTPSRHATISAPTQNPPAAAEEGKKKEGGGQAAQGTPESGRNNFPLIIWLTFSRTKHPWRCVLQTKNQRPWELTT